MTHEISDRLLTEAELAQRQCRSIKTIQNERIKGGGIPFVKIGRLVRYRWSDILTFEAGALRTSTSNQAEAKFDASYAIDGGISTNEGRR